jgi:adenosylcobinamide-phosphate synthase
VFIGGVPLVLIYKAINTLDSMVGYKNAKYKNFGWASAKLDDLANFIPARISVVFLVVSSWLSGHNAWGAWRIALRDSRKNPSPNSGIPEAAMAGALGIQLGGLNFYNSVSTPKTYIGDNNNPLEMKHIKESINIAYVSSVLFMVAGMFLFWLIRI